MITEKTSVILILLAVSISILAVYGVPENVQSIEIYVAYDPVIGEGSVYEKIVFDQYISDNGVVLDIPLINGSGITVINVTGDNGEIFPYSYDSKNNVLTIYVNNTQTINIYYMVADLMDEIGPDAYSGVIDLSIYQDIPVSMTIELPGKYSVDSEPDVETQYSDNTTVIKLDESTIYVITVYVSPETFIPTKTTTAYTASPTTTSTTTTSAAITQTSTPTPGITVSSRTTTTPAPAPSISPVIIGLIVIIAVIVIVVVVFALRR